jgi:hypothetical protein
MATIIISAFDVANYAEGGGHLWVYMQYALGLRRLGCDVYWLEQFRPRKDPAADARAREGFMERMRRFGFEKRVLLYTIGESENGPIDYISTTRAEAEAVLRRADLLLNFHYGIDPRMLAAVRRTALVDIDPGLSQHWISIGQIVAPRHDVYFTIGETVGTPAARFPDCGVEWVHIRPPVCLDFWPVVSGEGRDAFTTVAGWWSGKWVKMIENGQEVLRDNNKRVAFLEYLTLPGMTRQPLELALLMGRRDGDERQHLEKHGWRIRDAREAAGSPEAYRAYIQSSRGEWSACKPSCIWFQNAWVSDRTACYLASGKPVVVEHTGASAFLPNGEGMFRFTSLEEAAAALEAVNADYKRHCRAAREIAETYFDAEQILGRIVNETLGSTPRRMHDPVSPAPNEVLGI